MNTLTKYYTALLLLLLAGCQIGPDGKFRWNSRAELDSANTPVQTSSENSATSKISTSTVDKLTADNESLHAELAKARQQFRVTASELDLVKQQLKEANEKLVDKAGIDLSADTAESANKLEPVSIEGIVVGRDKNTIRIELPKSQLFNANTVTISNDGKTMLDRIAAAIKQQYPNQQIMLESHAASGLTPNDDHQQAIQQATAVYNYLVGMTQLPTGQFSLASKGNNNPRYSTASDQGIEANQRIELVVSPETY
ncbi:MAG: OmpA family protein [Planctomycetaceae bacterium]